MYPIEKYQFKTFKKDNGDGTSSIVTVAISTYAGKIVRGVAKCMHTDKFDPEIGKRLAAARCDLKVCNKRKERAFKKRYELGAQIHELTAKYIEMTQYYDDALEEAFSAKRRLKKIESDLT